MLNHSQKRKQPDDGASLRTWLLNISHFWVANNFFRVYKICAEILLARFSPIPRDPRGLLPLLCVSSGICGLDVGRGGCSLAPRFFPVFFPEAGLDMFERMHEAAESEEERNSIPTTRQITVTVFAVPTVFA